MKIKFYKKKVLVTGGTRGIGKKVAEDFAKNGATVTITGTSSAKPNWCNKIKYEQLVYP